MPPPADLPRSLDDHALAATPNDALVDLGGRRAFVTGGGRGLGAAIAARLAGAGASVLIGDLGDAGAETAARLRAEGHDVGHTACDITDPAQLHAAVRLAARDRLDILVNNAGIFPTTGPIDSATDEFVSRMLDVNVRAQFSAVREAARRMTSGGAIVNLASIAGIRGGANISAYAASKAAIGGMTRAFANELGPRGIRVNAIAPGVIDTPGVQDQLGPLRAAGVDIDRRLVGNPLGVHGRPDHIARVALFLCCDLAVFVNGQVIVVDGGDTA